MTRPWVVVLGNEKGGTGKSTVSMHVVVSYLVEGNKVGTIDVDARQGTLTRYLENRRKTAESSQYALPMPEHQALFPSLSPDREQAKEEDHRAVEALFEKFASCDVIIADTPGNNTFLSEELHARADTLITPINDSFIDLDMLVRIEGASKEILRPSVYAEMVWEQRKKRASRNHGAMDWIVLRNRLTTINAHNKGEVNRVLQALSKRIGFRIGEGFCERVIFKELFLSGLTVLDLEQVGTPMKLSHIAARQELKSLVKMIREGEETPSKEKVAHG
ncbi:MAG: division plane positioning ATPase MipZ [Holosporales bacterium]|jgi:chromosome partitioning protein|nr:division plane positioning ATPase MipZ [Holosporales bacterium]